MADSFEPFVRSDLDPSDILDSEDIGGWFWTLEETNDGTILRVQNSHNEFEYLIDQLDNLEDLNDLAVNAPIVMNSLSSDELDSIVQSLGVRILGKNRL